jgi:hypothetical protein
MSVIEGKEDAEVATELHRTESRNPNARPPNFKSTFQECGFVFSVTMAVAMLSFLSGSITVMSSFAGRELNMTTAELTWMNAASS